MNISNSRVTRSQIDMGGKPITNVLEPVSEFDAANKIYVD